LQAMRRRFAARLSRYLLEGRDIIYCDESTVNNHIRSSKCWQYVDKPVKQILDKKRIGSVTIYGAIGLCLMKPVFELGTSTNKEEFMAFLEKLHT
jgi:hypothetical protein